MSRAVTDAETLREIADAIYRVAAQVEESSGTAADAAPTAPRGPDEVERLRAENARLRKRLAEAMALLNGYVLAIQAETTATREAVVPLLQGETEETTCQTRT